MSVASRCSWSRIRTVRGLNSGLLRFPRGRPGIFAIAISSVRSCARVFSWRRSSKRPANLLGCDMGKLLRLVIEDLAADGYIGLPRSARIGAGNPRDTNAHASRLLECLEIWN